jgi:demethylmenaquinone methyltransferase/2-methoxy-6-polyprenyl-1,4-benzoquinol methylase
VRQIVSQGTENHLDIACGTGEIPVLLKRKLPEVNCVGLDFSWFMLREIGQSPDFYPLHADALSLPLKSDSFDSVSIAFGIRNMGDYGLFLREVHRVLKKGGRLYILELTRPVSLLLKPFFFLYLCILPVFSLFFAGKFAAYNYLARSIKAFPERNSLLELLKQQDYVETFCTNLSGGIVTLFCGIKRNFSA